MKFRKLSTDIDGGKLKVIYGAICDIRTYEASKKILKKHEWGIEGDGWKVRVVPRYEWSVGREYGVKENGVYQIWLHGLEMEFVFSPWGEIKDKWGEVVKTAKNWIREIQVEAEDIEGMMGGIPRVLKL